MTSYKLKFYNVIVKDGSGCLFQPIAGTNNYTYILTAKHLFEETRIEDVACLNKHEEKISIFRLVNINEEWKEEKIPFTLVLGENYFPHKFADAAILKIPSIPIKFAEIILKEVPDKITMGEYALHGFPEKFRNNPIGNKDTDYVLRELGSPASYLRNAQLTNDTVNIEQIKGMSGGGILSIQGNNIFIIGVQSEMKHANWGAGKICFTPMKYFVEITEYEEYNERLTKLTLPSISVETQKKFQKIPVKQSVYTDLLEDNYSYDLLTIAVLNRNLGILIYGHDKLIFYDLEMLLNSVENEFNSKNNSNINIHKRVWLFVKISDKEISEQLQNINAQISGISENHIGIIIDAYLVDVRSLYLSAFIKNIIDNNKSKQISIIIDYPSRNIEILKKIEQSLEFNKVTTLYVSNQISFENNIQKSKNSFVENIPGKNIRYFLHEILTQLKYSDFEYMNAKLNPFIKKLGLNSIANIDNSTFSFKEFIIDFERALNDEEGNKKEWESFFIELISVCCKDAPEFIEYIAYYSARSNNEFIRFKTLDFIIKNKKHLIDYWVEGNNCEKKYFENILENNIDSPAYHLADPILRYYNRHKNKEGLGEEILSLIDNQLKGRYLIDYPIIKKILTSKSNEYLNELVYENTLNIIKFAGFGVDVFEEMNDSILGVPWVDDNMLAKIILTTKMSDNKINVILRNYQYLIL